MRLSKKKLTTEKKKKQKTWSFIFKMQKLAENNGTHHKHFVMFTKDILGKEYKDFKYPHAVFAFKNKSREQNYIWNTLTMDRFFYQFNKTEALKTEADMRNCA